MDEIDVSGQLVAVWCDAAEARGFIERALAPLALRIVVVRDIDEIQAARPACALFFKPPLNDPAFDAAWSSAQRERWVAAIRIIPRGVARIHIQRDLYDDFVIIPFDQEELMMRVRRTIQRRLMKGPLMDQPPADS